MNVRKGLSLPKHLCARFASLPGEQMLLTTRKHWLELLIPGIGMGITGVSGTAALLFLFLSGILSAVYSLPFIIGIWTVVAGIFVFTFLSWYYHYYIVTNRKILEVRSLPYIYYDVNDVLLDQVRCTELDIKQDGFLASLVNMGSIIITFDRPTHQEEFTIANIHDPESVGIFLGDMFEAIQQGRQTAPQLWTKEKEGAPRRYRFSEEIFPRYKLS
ncbi:MAG: hypothetical protein HYV40_04505 [Candidatus Levybacteria bacterium]|nr:hypothetical protein [Candidatus Levybacteria bacterium]